ncbi:hypothetical protein C8Q74DRAFT_1038479 [Fomes fomentarius]|nr:hypothetical protein C8Q74DRAFT_1038479 [Fomes fomentarius]
MADPVCSLVYVDVILRSCTQSVNSPSTLPGTSTQKSQLFEEASSSITMGRRRPELNCTKSKPNHETLVFGPHAVAIIRAGLSEVPKDSAVLPFRSRVARPEILKSHLGGGLRVIHTWQRLRCICIQVRTYMMVPPIPKCSRTSDSNTLRKFFHRVARTICTSKLPFFVAAPPPPVLSGQIRRNALHCARATKRYPAISISGLWRKGFC